MKSFCSVKDLGEGLKTRAANGKKIFANHVSAEGLVCRLHEHAQNPTENNSNDKAVRKSEQTFCQRRFPDGKLANEKMPNAISREGQRWSHRERPPHARRAAPMESTTGLSGGLRGLSIIRALKAPLSLKNKKITYWKTNKQINTYINKNLKNNDTTQCWRGCGETPACKGTRC